MTFNAVMAVKMRYYIECVGF